jgi:hypothetical protein
MSVRTKSSTTIPFYRGQFCFGRPPPSYPKHPFYIQVLTKHAKTGSDKGGRDIVGPAVGQRQNQVIGGPSGKEFFSPGPDRCTGAEVMTLFGCCRTGRVGLLIRLLMQVVPVDNSRQGLIVDVYVFDMIVS